VLGEPQSIAARLLVLLVMVCAGAVEGLSLGWFQWRALRVRFPALAAKQWVSITAIVAAAGWLLGMLPPTLLPVRSAGPAPAATATFFLALLMGLGMGALFGAAQWWVLRRHVLHAGRWVAANALGWAVAMLWIFLAATLPGANTPFLAALALGAVCGLAAGLSLGAITGRWLVRF
jgi:hypothetical protein